MRQRRTFEAHGFPGADFGEFLSGLPAEPRRFPAYFVHGSGALVEVESVDGETATWTKNAGGDIAFSDDASAAFKALCIDLRSRNG